MPDFFTTSTLKSTHLITQASSTHWPSSAKFSFSTGAISAATLMTTNSNTGLKEAPEDDCIDKDTSACFYYKQNGYCESSYFLNQFHMSVADYCPQSCNLCTECVDSQPNCVLWASFDLCPKLATMHPNPCRKSCHVC